MGQWELKRTGGDDARPVGSAVTCEELGSCWEEKFQSFLLGTFSEHISRVPAPNPSIPTNPQSFLLPLISLP